MTRTLAVLTIALAACGESGPPPRVSEGSPLPPTPGKLRAPADFAAISDPAERARAIFTEASRVMLSPRCMNCHPAGETPLQGDNGLVHDPPVLRGDDDQGIPGLRCTGCHQDANLQLSRVPGAPKWQLAPIGMAWVGKTPHSLCEQLKDPARNGKRTLAQIVDHSAHDSLVAWAWAPGHDRVPAPGTQADFGELMDAWVKEGAVCP